MIRILTTPTQTQAFLAHLEARMPGENETVQTRVRNIVRGVRTGGRKALLAFRQEFEHTSAESLLTYSSEWFAARASDCPADVRAALAQSIRRVRAFHQLQVEPSRSTQDAGVWLGYRVQPLESVALYVPGGQAFYPSSVIMTAVPAQVAGVKRLAMFTPARGIDNPVLAAVVVDLGIQEVHAVGGAQAVAAAAFGIEGIARCDKIVGPGNVYVATAKQMLAGRIGTDGFAGPSEILVLGDGSSDPDWIAADLLAQAEHDAEASSVLVTTSAAEADAVAQSLERLLPQLADRQEIARASLCEWGAIIVVSSREQLATVANQIAPEHLHLHTSCCLEAVGRAWWLENLQGAGAIFFGRHSPEAYGDYLAGPSHVLPTAGTARFASPLGVYDFVRRSSLISFSPEAARELSAPTATFARAERLWAHALSASLRGGPEQ